MAGEPDWVPPEVDTRRANVARVYDYWLGGSHNFLADQDVAPRDRRRRAQHAGDRPGQPRVPRPGGAVPGRGRHRQFLDVGSGIPTEGNVHEVAQQAAPGSRVAYADVDPVAVGTQQGHAGGEPERDGHPG